MDDDFEELTFADGDYLQYHSAGVDLGIVPEGNYLVMVKVDWTDAHKCKNIVCGAASHEEVTVERLYSKKFALSTLFMMEEWLADRMKDGKDYERPDLHDEDEEEKGEMKTYTEVQLIFKAASHAEKFFYGIKPEGSAEQKSPLTASVVIPAKGSKTFDLKLADFGGIKDFSNVNIEQVRVADVKAKMQTSIQVVAKDDGTKLIFEITCHDANFSALVLENRVKTNTLTVDFDHSGGTSPPVKKAGILVAPGEKKCKDLPHEDLAADRTLNYFIKF